MITSQPALKEIVLEIANRLKDFETVASIAKREENHLPYINANPWDEPSLSHGYPGLIALFSELDHFFPNEGWDQICHQAIANVIDHIQTKGVSNFSLFSGLTGVCFPILLASKGKSRYRNLLTKLNTFVIKGIKETYLQPVKEDPQTLYYPIFYDVIVGASGIISYLLHFKEDEEIQKVTKELLSYLVKLTEPITIAGTKQPGWFIAKEYHLRDENKELYPNGCFDTGLAHGISGCLAALAKAHLQGVSVEGDKDAMTTIISWLKNVKCDHGKAKDIWYGRLGFNPENTNSIEIIEPNYRDGWCYGAPGIIPPLLLASKALDDKELYNYAVKCAHSLSSRPFHSHNLTCVSFCHGYAGLLTICHQIDLFTNSSVCSKTADCAFKAITEIYDKDLPFGFKCEAFSGDEDLLKVDNPGFLDGVAGTLLGLLFYSSKEQREWTEIFLIK